MDGVLLLSVAVETRLLVSWKWKKCLGVEITETTVVWTAVAATSFGERELEMDWADRLQESIV